MTFKAFLNAYLVPPLVYMLCRFLFGAQKVVFIDRDHETKILDAGSPRILSVWHGRLIFLAHVYRHNPTEWQALVSASSDGEIIARVLNMYGYGVVRGSSYKHAARALITLRREVGKGLSTVLIADGSRGPHQVMQPGAPILSKLTKGVPILPVTVAFSKKWTLKSWDNLAIPKPFGTAVVVYGDPVRVESGADEAALESARVALQAEMDRIVAIADAEAARYA